MDVSSKLTLYDLLAMLVPGWLIVVGSESHFWEEIDVCCPAIKTSLMLILAYIVGIVWNCLMEFVFRFVRNDISMIQHAFAENRESDNGFQRLLYIIWASCKLVCSLKFIFKCQKSANRSSKLDLYYKFYYYVAKNTYSNAIPVLEGQVALLRNTVVIVFVGLFPLEIFHDFYLRFIFSVLMYFAMVYRQYKVYELVRDDYNYLSKMKSKSEL